MFEVDFHILNQKATPAIYADTLANRPAASFAGRLFVDTASPYGIYRDTGTSWVQIASNGGGGSSTGINGLNGTTNIGLGGTLANNTTIDANKFNFIIQNGNNFLFRSQNAGNTRISELNITPLKSYLSSNNAGLSIYSDFIVEYNKQFSQFSGASFGLNLDDSTGKFVLGDYANARKYNSFVVDDDANTFYLTTSYNQVNTDQDLFYASNASSSIRFVKLGDFNNYANQYSLIIDDANEFIKTQNATGDTGIILTNSFAFLGSYNSTQYLFLSVDYGLNSINAYNSFATSNGLSLDFAALIYQFGGFNGNGNYIKVNDTTNDIETHTSSITFTGAALQSNSSSGSSGEHLVITLNGTQYKIDLKNP